MKKVIVLLLFINFTNCKYFNVEKTTSEAILEEELKTFNWNDVDVYPSFETCSTQESKEAKKKCFVNTLTSNLYNHLTAKEITVSQDIKDTIMVHFVISETGKIALINSKINLITKQEIPNIETLLLESLDALPKIYPAIKRGQQVKTQFTLPIEIRVD
ncbi:MAG: hypothetical protein ACPG6B_01005 [Oceanihabitans sp.]